MRRAAPALAAIGLLTSACGPTRPASAPGDAFPGWAFPKPTPPKTAPVVDSVHPLHIGNSDRAFTEAQLRDLSSAPDWRPLDHPVPPQIVMTGRAGGPFACGYCHLPTGDGRPENAALAGLPSAYIREQVAAMRGGARRGAQPEYKPTKLMAQEASQVSDADVAAAADYFAGLAFRSHLTVVEAAEVPAPVVKGYLLVRGQGPLEPLGQRIVEEPVSFEAFERRDPDTAYVAYVPRGALARGQALAQTGAGAATACQSCHGPGLRGGLGPPLAGRSPTALFRQLYAFKIGARSGGAADTMRAVAARLSQADMIAAAAYAGSLRP